MADLDYRFWRFVKYIELSWSRVVWLNFGDMVEVVLFKSESLEVRFNLGDVF
jgi:hypothetical protein